MDFTQFQFTARPTRAMSLSMDWDKVISCGTYAVGSLTKLTRYTFSADPVDHAGFARTEKDLVKFVTGSSYGGHWNALGMDGFGRYEFPHGNVLK